jgi:hypothetical protein
MSRILLSFTLCHPVRLFLHIPDIRFLLNDTGYIKVQSIGRHNHIKTNVWIPV